jgi:hypothetical protein
MHRGTLGACVCACVCVSVRAFACVRVSLRVCLHVWCEPQAFTVAPCVCVCVRVRACVCLHVWCEPQRSQARGIVVPQAVPTQQPPGPPSPHPARTASVRHRAPARTTIDAVFYGAEPALGTRYWVGLARVAGLRHAAVCGNVPHAKSHGQPAHAKARAARGHARGRLRSRGSPCGLCPRRPCTASLGR